MLNLEAIGKHIVELRTKHDMTQQQLADTLFVTHQAVSKWENGKTLPNIDILVSLTKLFHISIDELLQLNQIKSNQLSNLFKNYPRDYVINQITKGKIPFEAKNIFYLLNIDEREKIITHIINQDIQPDIRKLFPYLNEYERKRMIQAILLNQIETIKIKDIFYLLSETEKKIILRRKK